MSGPDLDPHNLACGLVDRMSFLYVRVVKAKRPTSEPDSSIFAKLLIGAHTVKTKSQSDDRDWDQVFAFDKEGLNSTSLEISVYAGRTQEIKKEKGERAQSRSPRRRDQLQARNQIGDVLKPPEMAEAPRLRGTPAAKRKGEMTRWNCCVRGLNLSSMAASCENCGRNPLHLLATTEINDSDAGKVVADYWDGNQWKWEEFSDIDDNFIWNRTSSGNFSLASALLIIRNDEGDAPNDLWKKIWRVEASERIRLFLWLVAHDCITGNANRVHRHLTSVANYSSCGNECESTLHIIRNCPRAREVWQELLMDGRRVEFFSGNIQDWLRANLSRVGSWPTRIAMGIWWVWKWRNMCTFGTDNIPIRRHEFIILRANEFLDICT
ncbi:hypothetical protein V2J09_006317 [Rumex salicifolius]